MKCIIALFAILFYLNAFSQKANTRLDLNIRDHAQAQKPAINSAVYDTWPEIGECQISVDGKYVAYTITTRKETVQLVVMSTSSNWKMEIPGNGIGRSKNFTNDSRFFLYSKKNDTLCVMELGTSNVVNIPGIASFSNTPQNEVVLKYKSNPKDLVIKNLSTDETKTYNNVNNYQFIKNAEKLLLNIGADNNSSEFIVVDRKTGKEKSIWKGGKVVIMQYDDRIGKLAFKEEDNSKPNGAVFRLYDFSTDKLSEISVPADQLGKDLVFDNIQRFTADGKRLFITLKEILPEADKNPVALNIWMYKDYQTHPHQFSNNEAVPKILTAVLTLDNNRLVKLQRLDDMESLSLNIMNDDYATLGGYGIAPGKVMKNEYYVINTTTGERRSLSHDFFHNGDFELSPGGRYAVCFDKKGKALYSYELATGATRNVTKDIPTEWDFMKPKYGSPNYGRGSIIAWIKNKDVAFLYDQYDIWAVDISGNKPPVNITNGYGKRNNIMFSLINRNNGQSRFSDNDEIKLVAFNRFTKENGFFKISLGQKRDPEKLTMSNRYVYCLAGNRYRLNEIANREPLKAKDAEMYIVQRQSAGESPNFFATSDFVNFKQLTNLAPEIKYNWFTTELHEWKSPDGNVHQGILYKPENFDPNKKYPVIFYYYEFRSDNLNVYVKPRVSEGTLNIAWYASNGYLVFLPDIHRDFTGNMWESCLNSIVSAGKYVARLPFVNSKKMGLQGHSWGGFQTNYYITKTNMFAAACSASGIADFMSHYNSLYSDHVAQYNFENGEFGSGKTLWEDREWFIKHSPVFNADKVQTPVLLFETTKDGSCPFVNVLEFYNGLRRLGKKVWMLEYTDGNHTVFGKSAEDFDIRMQQFFNYYLKDAPPPRWMTEGRPAKFKDIDPRLELDLSGKIP